jgi:cytochrome P450
LGFSMNSLDDTLGPLPGFLQQATEDVASIVAPTGDEVRLIGGYETGRQVLSDQRFSRSEAVKPGAPKFNDAQPVAQSIMSMDGPEHTRLRRIIAKSFSSRQIAQMAPLIESLADGYLDRLAAHGSPADLIEGLATPLPLAVLCSLLGVPEKDIDQFKDRVTVLFDISASSPKVKARSRIELVRYMRYLTGYKHQHPGDDLLTTLVEVHKQGDLSKEELITMGLSLLMAGYETTVGQIGLTVMAMLSEPGRYQRLVAEPGLLPGAIDETLRLTPAAPLSFTRVARERVPLGRATIEPGEAVVVSLLHANRDGQVFACPADPALEERAWPHLTFGYGSHRCPGAPLARTQLLIVLTRLVQRFPTLRLSTGPDAVSWKHGLAVRGLTRLVVTW